MCGLGLVGGRRRVFGGDCRYAAGGGGRQEAIGRCCRAMLEELAEAAGTREGVGAGATRAGHVVVVGPFLLN